MFLIRSISLEPADRACGGGGPQNRRGANHEWNVHILRDSSTIKVSQNRLVLDDCAGFAQSFLHDAAQRLLELPLIYWPLF